MYTEDTIEEVIYVKPLYKRADIVNAIKDDLTEQFTKENELKNAYEQAKFKTSDELHKILTEASQVFTKHKEFFDKMIEKNIDSNVIRKYAYVGYQAEQMISKNVTKFLINNEDFTYKEIYDFATKNIKND